MGQGNKKTEVKKTGKKEKEIRRQQTRSRRRRDKETRKLETRRQGEKSQVTRTQPDMWSNEKVGQCRSSSTSRIILGYHQNKLYSAWHNNKRSKRI